MSSWCRVKVSMQIGMSTDYAISIMSYDVYGTLNLFHTHMLFVVNVS